MNFKILKNVQILSAIIWALTIIICSYFTKNDLVSMTLITAAGFHVILMSQFSKSDSTQKLERNCS